jgi:vitamin K-dependent gamma-carboxylase-like protein
VSRLGRAWDAFWFRSESCVALGLFRMLFAFVLLNEIRTTFYRSVFAIEGGFHLPYVSFLGPVSERTFYWIQAAQVVPILLLGLGLFARPAIAALLLLQGYVFFSDQLNFRNHPYFFLLVLLLLLFSPCDEALSLKRVWDKARGRTIPGDGYLGPVRPVTAQRLIQMQVSIVYFFAALHKVNGWFLSGNGLEQALTDDLFHGWSGDALRALLSEHALASLRDLLAADTPIRLAAWGAVATELFLAFGLWFRRTRPLALALGIPLHLGIAFAMHIRMFSLATISSYLLFLDAQTVPRFLARAFGESEELEPAS